MRKVKARYIRGGSLRSDKTVQKKAGGHPSAFFLSVYRRSDRHDYFECLAAERFVNRLLEVVDRHGVAVKVFGIHLSRNNQIAQFVVYVQVPVGEEVLVQHNIVFELVQVEHMLLWPHARVQNNLAASAHEVGCLLYTSRCV